MTFSQVNILLSLGAALMFTGAAWADNFTNEPAPVIARGEDLVRDGRPVRFWGVNTQVPKNHHMIEAMTASNCFHGMTSSMRARNFSRRVIFFLEANSAWLKLVWWVMQHRRDTPPPRSKNSAPIKSAFP